MRGRDVRRALLAVAVLGVGTAAAAQVVNHDFAVQAIMANGVNPAALAFWAGGNDPPEGETPEAAKIRWAAALKGAQDLQVHANALATPERSRPGHWNEFAKLMADTGAEGELAAKAQNAEKAFELGGQLYDACNGCHKTYIPSPRLP